MSRLERRGLRALDHPDEGAELMPVSWVCFTGERASVAAASQFAILSAAGVPRLYSVLRGGDPKVIYREFAALLRNQALAINVVAAEGYVKCVTSDQIQLAFGIRTGDSAPYFSVDFEDLTEEAGRWLAIRMIMAAAQAENGVTWTLQLRDGPIGTAPLENMAGLHLARLLLEQCL
jgi:hypothetical protein